ASRIHYSSHTELQLSQQISAERRNELHLEYLQTEDGLSVALSQSRTTPFENQRHGSNTVHRTVGTKTTLDNKKTKSTLSGGMRTSTKKCRFFRIHQETSAGPARCRQW
ncbi:unnamed protein product, partial [Ectocarpus sp. 12 AP-2014]